MPPRKRTTPQTLSACVGNRRQVQDAVFFLAYGHGITTRGEWIAPAAQINPQAETWFDRVAERAYVYWQTDNWSKHWFKQFFNAENNIHAWAAFRLLLRCVDRRFWTWQDELLSNILRRDDSNHRLIFLKNNKDTLSNSIKKNEKAMTENFLATKVLDNQAWPWMRVEIKTTWNKAHYLQKLGKQLIKDLSNASA